MKLPLILLSAALLQPLNVAAADVDTQTVQDLISSAKQDNQAASDLGHAWRNNAKALKAAEKALASGDLAKALTLAEHAALLAKAAHQQGLAEQKAAPRF